MDSADEHVCDLGCVLSINTVQMNTLVQMKHVSDMEFVQTYNLTVYIRTLAPPQSLFSLVDSQMNCLAE